MDAFRMLKDARVSISKPSARRTQKRAAARQRAEAGKVRPGILLWALGVPIPIVLLIVLLRGCV